MYMDGPWFKDEYGRTLILRGVNLGGSSKVPSQPDGATHLREGFYDHRNVSFIDRPFPLHEAEEHFARLRAWGLTLLRLVVPWEAIEHAGPGIYDQAYLDYLVELVHLAAEAGFQLFIDPHQDVWSRLSGGDGAPGWTLEAVGMDVTRLSDTGAAIVHAVHGDPFPRMIWPTNYGKLAAATMFTLFFGGNDFAPQTLVDGEPVQEFLQRHYVAAIQQVAFRLKGLSAVVGYDTLNEPSPGWIGFKDLNSPGGLLQLGATPTPYQSMLLGAGFSQEVEVWDVTLRGLRKRGQRLLNLRGVSAWQEGTNCVWRENGVWDVASDGSPFLRRPDHFARVNGRPVDFGCDYLYPFWKRYACQIRAVDPGAVIFLEAPPRHLVPRLDPAEIPQSVHAAHWYDGFTILLKRYLPFLAADFETGALILGRRRIRSAFARQIDRLKVESSERLGGIPTFIGEFGIPFDLQGGRAYRTGDFSLQVRAMGRTFQALDDNLLSGTLWNYTSDNTNERGDQWNGEDLSIFSRDQQTNPRDIHSGGRALSAVVRPYARKVAGQPLEMSFDRKRRTFYFAFRHDPAVDAPTEIFVPECQYPSGYDVDVSEGDFQIQRTAQVVRYRHSCDREVHTLRIRPARP